MYDSAGEGVLRLRLRGDGLFFGDGVLSVMGDLLALLDGDSRPV